MAVKGVLEGSTDTLKMLGGGLRVLGGLGLVLGVGAGRVAVRLVFKLKPKLSRVLGLRATGL